MGARESFHHGIFAGLAFSKFFLGLLAREMRAMAASLLCRGLCAEGGFARRGGGPGAMCTWAVSDAISLR